MQDSIHELSKESWRNHPIQWTRKETGQHGVVISTPLPQDPDLAKLLMRVWKKELRLWWSAWTDGLKVLEPCTWWRSEKQFHVWCISSSHKPLINAEISNEDKKIECQRILRGLHSRKLAHGELNELAFFEGSDGLELSPPINRTVLSISLEERMDMDRAFFLACTNTEPTSSVLEHSASSQILATLSAETLASYELVYYCQLESNETEDFSQKTRVLRLFRKEPHPEMGPLRRPTASQFYHSMLREMEGEQLSLVLSSSHDPFETKGVTVSVVGDHPTDEDCLIVKGNSKVRFKTGWCRPRDIGKSNLIQRKREILDKAVNRKHIFRITRLTQKPRKLKIDYQSLSSAIVQNEGIFCVQGPPGTGKTHLACDVVGSLLEKDPDARILVCAKEHQALHILREKLLLRFGDKIESSTVVSFPRDASNIKQEGSSFAMIKEIVRKAKNENLQSNWNHALREMGGQPSPILDLLYEETAQVVFATTTSWSMNSKRFNYFFEPFDFVVVEEAGKCYPSEILAPLAISRNALLIGDQNQLPPFQLNEAKEAVEYLKELCCNNEGLSKAKQKIFGEIENPSINWEEVKLWLQTFSKLQSICPRFMLHDQYRMIPTISNLISSTFYETEFINRKSKESSKALYRHPLLGDIRLIWVDAPYWADDAKAREDLTGHRFNKMEMGIISKLLNEIEYCGNETPDIAILSPYNAQVDRLAGNHGLNSALPEFCPKIPNFNPRNAVHTVDSFQGNEADLVIVSLVRNNGFGNPNNAWGFVSNPERLNVMLSRARRHLVVVGCSSMIDLYATYEEMKPLVSTIQYFRKKGKIFSAKEIGVSTQ
jgi:hypothetical protein